MNNSMQIWVLNSSSKGRAGVNFALAQLGLHADLFEDFAELPLELNEPTLLLIEERLALSSAFVAYLGSLNEVPGYIVLSEEPNWQSAVSAMRANALDYLPWPCPRQTLAEAIAQAGADSRVSVHQRQRRDVARQRVERLSKREREVLSGVTRGMTNKDIAAVLGISHRTVDVHRANLIHKLMVHNTPEAIKVAIDAGMPL
ncbi:MAG: hypothetical protein JSS36_02375 [Proteobacteria bacterium]|nr:hypothetical protein [Pseudomonadota bacterium]